jgi:uncharacterized protein YndB with AHSA1/START domain
VSSSSARKEGHHEQAREGVHPSRDGDLGNGRTKVVNTSLFHTTEERDGMLNSGMEEGLNQGYAALDRLLATSI